MAEPPPDKIPQDYVVGSPAEILTRALAAFEDGDLDRCEDILRQVLEQQDELASAWHLRGLAARKAGNLDRAAEYLARAVTLAPDNPRYCADFGHVMESGGRLDAAAAALAQAAALAPIDPTIPLLLGNVLARIGRSEAAIDSFNRSLKIDPDRAETHGNLAAVLREAGEVDNAIHHAELAIGLRADYPEALNNLALALCDAGCHAEALERLEAALALRPDDPELLNNIGVALNALDRLDEAEQHLRAALDRRPDWPEALINLGNLLRQTDRLEEAMTCYRGAVEAQPLDFQAYGNLALILLNLGKPEEAIAVYEKALALEPDQPDIRMSLGIVELLTGDFEAGWENYESRWQADSFSSVRRQFDVPRWAGQNPAGRRILVTAEQGFGDTLQFCRYVPLLAARGADIRFECQQALTRLMGSLAGVPAPIARGDPLPEADFQVPLLSLPGLFGTTLDTVPAESPYLSAPEDLAAEWGERISGDGMKVGIVWSGNPRRQDDAMRSCPPASLAPVLAVPGARFFSLQKDAAPGEGMSDVVDLAPDLGDFADTAAAVEALDLVITIDSAVAHLAGALGRPVWVMLGFSADWRYLTGREDSPWYPSMRLFRPGKRGDWSGLAARVADRLAPLAANR